MAFPGGSPHDSASLAVRAAEMAATLQQIPAPTFAERARAEFVYTQWQALGLADLHCDEHHNVTARLPGGKAPAVLVTAHTDTVFPLGTPLTLHRTAERLAGPGIGDNALGVAGLFALIWAWQGRPLPGDVWLAANTCEEGLGDLRGMKQVFAQLGHTVQATLVLEGMALGHVQHQAIGVRRYRLSARAPGGHSWLDYGRPSAIHALTRLAAQLADLPVPTHPKTSLNIGTFHGGLSVNTIASEAQLELDLRSEDPAALFALASRVEQMTRHFNAPGVTLTCEVVGQRPSGQLARHHPLVQLAARAIREIDLEPRFEASSTDANIPLSLEQPAVCIGLTHGANAHRADEYIDLPPLQRGLHALLETVWGTFALRL